MCHHSSMGKVRWPESRSWSLKPLCLIHRLSPPSGWLPLLGAGYLQAECLAVRDRDLGPWNPSYTQGTRWPSGLTAALWIQGTWQTTTSVLEGMIKLEGKNTWYDTLCIHTQTCYQTCVCMPAFATSSRCEAMKQKSLALFYFSLPLSKMLWSECLWPPKNAVFQPNPQRYGDARTRTNGPKVCMGPQKSPNSQSSLKKEELK